MPRKITIPKKEDIVRAENTLCITDATRSKRGLSLAYKFMSVKTHTDLKPHNETEVTFQEVKDAFDLLTKAAELNIDNLGFKWTQIKNAADEKRKKYETEKWKDIVADSGSPPEFRASVDRTDKGESLQTSGNSELVLAGTRDKDYRSTGHHSRHRTLPSYSHAERKDRDKGKEHGRSNSQILRYEESLTGGHERRGQGMPDTAMVKYKERGKDSEKYKREVVRFEKEPSRKPEAKEEKRKMKKEDEKRKERLKKIMEEYDKDVTKELKKHIKNRYEETRAKKAAKGKEVPKPTVSPKSQEQYKNEDSNPQGQQQNSSSSEHLDRQSTNGASATRSDVSGESEGSESLDEPPPYSEYDYGHDDYSNRPYASGSYGTSSSYPTREYSHLPTNLSHQQVKELLGMPTSTSSYSRRL